MRSIEKYLKGYGDVYLIADKWPEWYNGKVILHPDVSSRKQLNIISKLFQVPQERFIFWNDDHFLLKELHVNEIKTWYHGTIREAIGKAQGKYYTALRNTCDTFGDIRNADIHVPCIYEAKRIKEVFGLNWADKDYVIKSAYFNNESGEEITDCKINRPISKEEIEERIKDRLFFSTGPNGLKTAMIKKLNELYPEPSKYESL